MLGVHDAQAHQRVLVHSHQAPARHILDRKHLYKSVKHDFVYTVSNCTLRSFLFLSSLDLPAKRHLPVPRRPRNTGGSSLHSGA